VVASDLIGNEMIPDVGDVDHFESVGSIPEWRREKLNVKKRGFCETR
jgi:hypothetical protein